MTPQETTQIENFKAHYNILVGNINTANKELEEVLEKKRVAVSTYQQLCSDIEKGISELDSIINQKEQIKINIEDRLKFIESSEKILNKQKEEFDIYLREERAKLTAEKEKSIIAIGESKKILQELHREITEQQEKYVAISKENALLKETNNKLILERNEIESDINSLTNNFNDLYKGALSEKKKIINHLEELRQKAEDEKQKIKKPLELLQLRENEINTKAKNLDVLIRRFKKHFKKIYPDQEIHI